MTRVTWDTRLVGVVGGKAGKLIVEELGLQTVGGLLEHYPRRYMDVTEVSSFKDLEPGLVTLVAKIIGADIHPYTDKRTKRTAYRVEVKGNLGDGPIWMTFFERNRGTAEWRAHDQLEVGKLVVLSGELKRNGFRHDRWELVHPEVTAPEDDFAQLMAVYPTSGKLRSDQIRQSVRLVLDVVADVPDPLPGTILEKHGLLEVGQAIRWIHRPQDRRQAGAATKRLKFDEAFVAQVALAQRRHEQREIRGEPRTGRAGGIFDAFDARMPFELTSGQHAVEREILSGLAAEHPMHRLLQGEVGSGKTVLALRAMLRVVDSRAQAALLAPTEVLAQQHHRSITRMLGDLAEAGRLGAADDATRVTLLTGSMAAGPRKEAMLDIASGAAGIVIGTHALLEEKVQFADLGLVVVDEQHRFGVEQRAALKAKTVAVPPHELVMTATPIPRTVAMTVFGDLETSTLSELPAGRSPIQTTVVPLADQPGWIDRVWARVREEVQKGHQVYVVCARIAGDAKDDTADADLLEPPEDEAREGRREQRPPPAAVEEVGPSLAEGPLSGLRVEMLHGRMAPEAKDAVMLGFARGETDVLVSTTVIEVGVDVANATTMVILDADRFGVSQLHQLRGRVGRGGHHGLCLLVTTASAASASRARLEAVAATTDGFQLAELDLETRREGEIFGTRQSGRATKLRLLSVIRDVDVIEEARGAASELVGHDPALEDAPVLRAAVEALQHRAETDYLDKA